jgi:hypothetical protein
MITREGGKGANMRGETRLMPRGTGVLGGLAESCLTGPTIS